ncbi:hypothetical protein B296_00027165, partial [Ensete ventricosum]
GSHAESCLHGVVLLGCLVCLLILALGTLFTSADTLPSEESLLVADLVVTFKAELGRLSSLSYLILEYLSISGKIPTSLFDFSPLQTA